MGYDVVQTVRRLVGRQGLAFGLILLSIQGAAAEGYAELYRAGVAQRLAGNFAGATRVLEAARRLRPNSADVLVQLGAVYAAQKRYDSARESYRQALAHAPESADARMGLARVHFWNGRDTAAAAALAPLLRAAPDNAEALTLRARIHQKGGDHEAAAMLLRRVVALKPGDTAALVALGDSLNQLGQPDRARGLYRMAGRIDPSSRQVARRLTSPDTEPARPPWRFDLGAGYSGFTGQSREPWQEGFFQVTRDVGPDAEIHMRSETARRFGAADTYLQGGVMYRFGPRASVHVFAGGTPAADFLPQWRAGYGAALRLSANGGRDATYLTIDGRVARYGSGTVASGAPGVRQFLWRGRARLDLGAIYTDDEAGRGLWGWKMRAQFQATPLFQLVATIADAPETAGNETLDTSTYHAGMIVDLGGGVSLRLDYTHEDRAGAYVRHGGAASLSFRL